MYYYQIDYYVLKVLFNRTVNSCEEIVKSVIEVLNFKPLVNLTKCKSGILQLLILNVFKIQVFFK